MKEMDLSRPKVDVARVVKTGFLRLLPPAPCPRECPSSQGDHHCRGTARRPSHARWTTSTYKLGNVGVTEDRGWVVWRIKEDLKPK